MKVKKQAKFFEPKEFEKNELFEGYSLFCQDTIRKLNNKLPSKYPKYYICTRNGSDTKITFKVNYEDKEVLLTLKPNKTLKSIISEIRVGESQPIKILIENDDDINAVLTII
ncbi:hypothetical protein [Clostridium saccharoperbutylacetonicum]